MEGYLGETRVDIPYKDKLSKETEVRIFDIDDLKSMAENESNWELLNLLL